MRLLSLRTTEDKLQFMELFATLPELARKDRGKAGALAPQVLKQFLQMAPAEYSEFWLALEGDRPLGTIGASLLGSYPGQGAVGFFEVHGESEEECAKALLEAACLWLKTKGCHSAVGPMNLNTWFPYRFRMDSHPKEYAWEPCNPSSYPEHWLTYGFEVIESYQSLCTSDLAQLVSHTRKAWEKCVSEGYTFRPFDGTKVMEQEVPHLYRISMKGFEKNLYFEPISQALFSQLYVPIANKMDFSHSFFALSPEGQEVGFFFCFVDDGKLILKSTTVMPSHRGRGLSNALNYLTTNKSLSEGIKEYVSALVRRGAQSESYSKQGSLLWVHEYGLMKKNL